MPPSPLRERPPPLQLSAKCFLCFTLDLEVLSLVVLLHPPPGRLVSCVVLLSVSHPELCLPHNPLSSPSTSTSRDSVWHSSDWQCDPSDLKWVVWRLCGYRPLQGYSYFHLHNIYPTLDVIREGVFWCKVRLLKGETRTSCRSGRDGTPKRGRFSKQGRLTLWEGRWESDRPRKSVRSSFEFDANETLRKTPDRRICKGVGDRSVII